MCHPDNETVSVILLFTSSPFLNAQLMKVGHSGAPQHPNVFISFPFFLYHAFIHEWRDNEMDPLRFFKHKIRKCKCEIGEKSEESFAGSETNPKLMLILRFGSQHISITITFGEEGGGGGVAHRRAAGRRASFNSRIISFQTTSMSGSQHHHHVLKKQQLKWANTYALASCCGQQRQQIIHVQEWEDGLILKAHLSSAWADILA